MILGLGKIGRLLAKSLQIDYNVKILENNPIKAKKYSSDLDESNKLNELGYEVHIADLIMNTIDKKNALAEAIIHELESK